MSALANDYTRCELINLGYDSDGRGPYVIRQEGYPPNTMTFEVDRYYLRRDGTWLINLAMFALPEKEKDDFVYESVEAVIVLLEGLTGEPSVEYHLPEGKSIPELRAAAESHFTGLWGRIHQRHESGAAGME
ncbi:hypothetical protein [Roseimicrobium sp. ORNL1]|uniref:hypothetical protein n=1 Tax=Roseimicrobium sp. ORNL1 TaxID=2711231 RepID=UPI0013E14038|nr:hypothetical protein [Roseimicrobium sp. ORNL1]QIF03247.1 hypothetical protein G5S37_17530 [Roseimicrobium sp. ORNL1]